MTENLPHFRLGINCNNCFIPKILVDAVAVGLGVTDKAAYPCPFRRAQLELAEEGSG